MAEWASMVVLAFSFVNVALGVGFAIWAKRISRESSKEMGEAAASFRKARDYYRSAKEIYAKIEDAKQ